MRDVDHRGAVRGRLPHLAEYALDHVGAERRGRLVEDEDPRLQSQCLRELDQLSLGDAEILHARVAVDVAADSLELCPDPVRPGAVFCPVCLRNREQHVLAHRQIGQERGMLVHDREPELPRDSGVRPSDSVPPISIVPESGTSDPEATAMSVDLPAPFSPSNACTSPARAANVTSESATTPGKRFQISESRISTGAVSSTSLLSQPRGARGRPAPAPDAVAPPFYPRAAFSFAFERCVERIASPGSDGSQCTPTF
jgi:hypothetical protein